MARILEMHDAAVSDAAEARARYEENSARAADRFLKEFDRAIDCIKATPEAWPEYDADTKYFQLRKFPYLVIYCLTDDMIAVVAVAHAKRDSGYWKVRLKDYR